MKPHAFVAMPFGTKAGADGVDIDFNRVFDELLKPALDDAGCSVFRADEEQRGGDIRADMFQELLAADLVLADLTLDNPNVWYELGVRHALRSRGVVLVQGPRPTSPFDIYTDRKLRYRIADGGPDPAHLKEDRDALAAMARATLTSSVRRKVSPVYTLLPHLREPAWRELLMDDANEFGAAYAQWRSRMEVARQKNRAGDILVLAGETPTQALWVEAKCAAGAALLKMRQFAFALEQFDDALAVDPDNVACRNQRIVCLGRLGRHEEAHEAARQWVEERSTDPEAWSLAGRVEKERWLARWRTEGAEPAQLRAAAEAEVVSLEEAIAPYHQAFIADPSAFYPGINSLTLHLLLRHLGGEVPDTVIDNLTGGVLWATLAAQKRSPKDYWARATYAELCVLLNPLASVQREMRSAVAAANRDWFALDSTRQTLALLQELEFRPVETAAAIAIVDAEIARLTPPFVPRQVVLFSGHMMDAPDRPQSRFPPAKEAAVKQAIDAELDRLGVGPEDLTLSQASAGADLLFVEAAQRRGAVVRWLLPLAEAEFVDRSVRRSSNGADWATRFHAARDALRDPPREMPQELGPAPADVNVFERCNQWLLCTALAWGVPKVRFVCVWDGAGGDGPGGTQHMFNEVKRRSGRVAWIDMKGL